MPVTSLYQCSRCSKEYNFYNVKYNSENKLICLPCFKQLEALNNKDIDNGKAENSRQINFMCLSCRFKFPYKKGSPRNLSCPYCGKTELMHVKGYKDENDLIKDSMDKRFNY